MSRWLRRRGLQESHCHLSLLLKKNCWSNPALAWGIRTQFGLGGRKFKRNNLQKFKCPGGSWNWSTQFLSLRWTDASLTRKLILLRLRVWYPLFPERSFLTHRSFSSRRANVVATVGKWTLTSRHGWSAKLSASPSTVSRFFTKII